MTRNVDEASQLPDWLKPGAIPAGLPARVQGAVRGARRLELLADQFIAEEAEVLNEVENLVNELPEEARRSVSVAVSCHELTTTMTRLGETLLDAANPSTPGQRAQIITETRALLHHFRLEPTVRSD